MTRITKHGIHHRSSAGATTFVSWILVAVVMLVLEAIVLRVWS